MATDVATRDETDVVQAWRAERLELAGYREKEAAKLARRFDVDLHLAVDLVTNGCPAELALKILL